MEKLAKRDEAIRDAVLRGDLAGFKEISRDNGEAISPISDAEGKASPEQIDKMLKMAACIAACNITTMDEETVSKAREWLKENSIFGLRSEASSMN